MPVLLPRADFTILDAKADKLLQKYQLCIENLWSGPQQLRKQMEAVSLPAELGENFDKKKSLIESTLTELGAEIQKLDATLAGAVETTREKMSFQLNKLREKTGRALDERAGLIAEHSDFLENLLVSRSRLTVARPELPAVSVAVGRSRSRRTQNPQRKFQPQRTPHRPHHAVTSRQADPL